MQIARGARTCRRIPVEDFEGQIRPDLALALLRRFQRISDRVGECLPKLAVKVIARPEFSACMQHSLAQSNTGAEDEIKSCNGAPAQAI